MVTFLARFFIKDEFTEKETRSIYGFICGGVGIFLNILLFVGKLFAGIVSGSISITADAFNNLSDAGSSVISIVGFKLASQKPDRQHPYGHGRIEYVSGLIISGLILLMGFELAINSVKKLFTPDGTTFSILILIILAVSILTKCYMAYYNFNIGKKIDSATVKAVATDSLSDCIATSIVLISMLVEHFFNLNVDGIGGIIVSIFILFSGFEAAKDTINPLLGGEPDEELVNAITERVLNFDEKIIGIHDLMVHDYGPGRKFVSLHAEVPANENILAIHDIIDVLEVTLQLELDCMATIHMDPIVTDDPLVNELKSKVKDTVSKIDPALKVHDFRTVIGQTHTNLVFDIEVPFDFNLADTELQALVQNNVFKDIGPNYFVVTKIDKY